MIVAIKDNHLNSSTDTDNPHLRDVMVVVDVVAQKALLLEVRHPGLHHLVEDVVAPLDLLLEGDPRLLKEVGLDVAARQFSLDVEVDADELSLSRRQ